MGEPVFKALTALPPLPGQVPLKLDSCPGGTEVLARALLGHPVVAEAHSCASITMEVQTQEHTHILGLRINYLTKSALEI